MESLEDIYRNRRVFLTGTTGFKGSWLSLWLARLGATVRGFSRDVPSEPNHFSLLNHGIEDRRGDIRDVATLRAALLEFEPEIVFHLAAQPLVRRSYAEPLETFSTNVVGTANLLQVALESETTRAIVVTTTDKVYENGDRTRQAYRETDRLGGDDPYAASKACAELVAGSFRKSFFESRNKLLATVRAGNVIGGGDWAEDRLIPDLMRTAAEGGTTRIRMPHAVRPWEHVLEPIRGYLLLGGKLWEGDASFADAWNFGPPDEGHVSVGEIVEQVRRHWNRVRVEYDSVDGPHEANYLALDCTKSRDRLGWRPVWDLEETVFRTARWYREYYETGRVLSHEHLERYIESCVLIN